MVLDQEDVYRVMFHGLLADGDITVNSLISYSTIIKLSRNNNLYSSSLYLLL
jgi:hypothetical protein